MPRAINESEMPLSVTEFNDFVGIVLQSDTIGLPPGGAQDQSNIKCDRTGCMVVRDGMMRISFDSILSY